jgi:hypothetical protein
MRNTPQFLVTRTPFPTTKGLFMSRLTIWKDSQTAFQATNLHHRRALAELDTTRAERDALIRGYDNLLVDAYISGSWGQANGCGARIYSLDRRIGNLERIVSGLACRYEAAEKAMQKAEEQVGDARRDLKQLHAQIERGLEVAATCGGPGWKAELAHRQIVTAVPLPHADRVLLEALDGNLRRYAVLCEETEAANEFVSALAEYSPVQ